MRKIKSSALFLFAGVLGAASCTAAVAAEDYDLTPATAAARHVKVQLEVRGHLQIPQSRAAKDDEIQKDSAGDAFKPLPLSVDGALEYDEKPLPSDSGEFRAARIYRKTKGVVQVDGREFRPSLDADRRLILASCQGPTVKLHGLQGALTREELELVDVQANSLVLDQLLPPSPVAIGAAWELAPQLLVVLFRLDAAQSTRVTATLEKIESQQATLQLKGGLEGTASNVPTHIELEGTATFDLSARQLSRVDLRFHEQRKISGAQPGIDARSRLRVELSAVSAPTELSEASLADLLRQESADLIRFAPRQGGVTLHHDPRWRVISDSPNLAVLRLIDGGDVLAQGNLSPLPALAPNKQLSLEAYQRDVQKTLESHRGQVSQSEQQTTSNNLTLLRVTAVGTIKDVNVEWVYLHLSNSEGQRVSCVFTLDAKMAERFYGAELELVSGIEFLKPQPTAVQASRSGAPNR